MSETAPTTSTTPLESKPLWTNPMTMAGLLFVALGILLLVTFWLFAAFSHQAHENQYIGLVGFMILPGVLVNGLVMCPVGIWLRKRKLKKKVDLKVISTRKALAFLGITFFLILPILGVAGYQGYHFTETSEFCGTICHNMDPQYVRYKESPHARVTCAGCHIGPGATPFVKAKLSGMRQVFKTMADTYPRPVPAAIAELRPARDTCEQCHNPAQFFGQQIKKFAHFSPDKNNTRTEYEILIKVGGRNNQLGKAEGIHMHMLDHVEYVAEDHHLQKIPWVRYTRPDGTKVVFRSDGQPSSAPPPQGHGHEAKIRKLDCIDCHNLIGHDALSPERSVDHDLSINRLDPTLPYIKRESVRILSGEYKTREEGLEAIRKHLLSFYQSSQPEVWKSRQKDVEKAIEVVQGMYRQNHFPDMKVDWRTYPSNIGHLESPGCFRCHDGLHVADDGKRITNDCSSCHSFLYRQPNSNVILEKKFDHPMKIHDEWKGLGPHEKMVCTDCHDGGTGALGWGNTLSASACGDCHPKGRWLEIRKEIQRREAASTRPVSVPGATLHP